MGARARNASGRVRDVAVEIIRAIALPTIRKARRVEKKPVPKRTRFKTPHVSTEKSLDRVLG